MMVAGQRSGTAGEVERIRGLMTELTRSWLGGELDALQKLFHENAVTVRPGFNERAEGRENCIRGYTEFVRNAVLRRYDETDHHIDVCGTTAVATYHFDIAYEMGGREFHETGRDVLVLGLGKSGWQVVWRTVLPLSRDVRDRSVTV